jgi:hypothetical protein
VFREREGKSLRESQPTEVVAFCDHLGLFRWCEPEYKILGKAPDVALHLFVQALRPNPIDAGEIGIEQHALAPQHHDAQRNVSVPGGLELCLHR